MRWSILSWVCRLLVGGILVASALGKSLDLPGFVNVLITYQAIPGLFLWPVALTVTGVELLLGVLILFGWWLATGALAALVLNAIYTIWMTLALFQGLDLANCGCYGTLFPQPLRWYTPLEDLVLVGLCYALLLSSKKVKPPLTPYSEIDACTN
jgi:uncharacterized membrane protein YphA (DoxX/SURF4 family)